MENFRKIKSLPGPIFVTGHTGFKGSWLTALLEILDIPWFGYSLRAERDSLYSRMQIPSRQCETFADIRDYENLLAQIERVKPSAVIHMAAQPLVLRSYKEPRYTFDVNVMGTVNVLEAARNCGSVKYVVVATTDKVYLNSEKGNPFKESDPLGGHDPYSASKAGTEMAVEAWRNLNGQGSNMNISSVRAGNVIGGGDYSENRLLPDLIRGFFEEKVVEVRNPSSIRPWQHVLDPLLGYLSLIENGIVQGPPRAVNFGPIEKGLSVFEVVECAQAAWGLPTSINLNHSHPELHEAATLQLNSSWARENLNWENLYTQIEAVHSTVDWWKKHLKQQISARELVREEIISRLQ
jgi:CDP-glucose 4,6-dehydratase